MTKRAIVNVALSESHDGLRTTLRKRLVEGSDRSAKVRTLDVRSVSGAKALERAFGFAVHLTEHSEVRDGPPITSGGALLEQGKR